MDKEEDVDGTAETESTKAAACKKHARLHRSFLHLSKALKKLHARRGHHQQANASGEPPTPSSSAAASFLSGCMHHPRTHSFASGRRQCHKHEDHGDDALAVNFRSLRVAPDAAVAGHGSSSSAQDYYSSDGSEERQQGVAPPPPPPPALADKTVVGGAGVAMVTLSVAPYEDFRRSMREMVDAAGTGSGGAGAAPAVDWDFMEELLFCYLHLNDRAVHKDILRAFTDTVAALRRRRRAAAARSRRTRRQQRRWGAGAGGSDDGAEDAWRRRDT